MIGCRMTECRLVEESQKWQCVEPQFSEKRRNVRFRAALEGLGAVRMDSDTSVLRNLRKMDQAFIVVDESGLIISATPREIFYRIGAEWAFDISGACLSPELASVARCAHEEWFIDGVASDTLTIYRGKHSMMFSRLRGILTQHLMISFQVLARRTTLRDEALRYDLTPREYEVLRLALGGFSSGEIAHHLAIADTTAQVYLKRLLQKTNSRNRAQMVTTVLGSRMSHDAEVRYVIAASGESASVHS